MKFILIVLPVLISVLVLAAIGYGGWYIYMKLRYKTVGPDSAMIVYGPNLGKAGEPGIYTDENGRMLKIIRGGGHRLKMFQDKEDVPLKSFQLYINTPEIYTSQKVKIFAQATATIKVASSNEGLVRFAEQFSGKGDEEIRLQVERVLDTHLRAILSKMPVEKINDDLKAFNDEVKEISATELEKMGFEIISLGLSSIGDKEGYLENLGKPQIAEVKKAADIAEAENNRETQLKLAEVQEDIEKERYTREMAIAESRKEKDLKDSKILAQTERERATAEASYSLEQEQRKLEIDKQRLQIVEQEKETELRLKEMERATELKLQEREVELESKRAEIRQKQADADFYIRKRAAEADSESKLLEGKADADVIKLKSQAEVEALKDRAEAMNKYKDVLITEKLIEMVPEYAKAVSSSLSNVESIRILDGGSGDQIKAIPNVVTGMMANMNEGLEQMVGIDLTEVVDNISKGRQVNITNVEKSNDKTEETISSED